MTDTCRTWCRNHDAEFGFCHSDGALVGGVDVHLIARDNNGETRVCLSTENGLIELDVDTASALFHSGLAQTDLAKVTRIFAVNAEAGAR